MEALRWPLAGQVLKAGIHEFFVAKGSVRAIILNSPDDSGWVCSQC